MRGTIGLASGNQAMLCRQRLDLKDLNRKKLLTKKKRDQLYKGKGWLLVISIL